VRTFLWLSLSFCSALQVFTQHSYKTPDREIAEIITAPPNPVMAVDPQRHTIALLSYRGNPPVALLSRRIERLGGIRIDPALNSPQRIRQYTGIRLKAIATGKETKLALPAGVNLSSIVWSHDGSQLALLVDAPVGVELWTAEAASGALRKFDGVLVNGVIARPSVQWLSDNRTLLVAAIPKARGAMPIRSLVPEGPVVQETAGKFSRMATFQDLLQGPFDEDHFDFLARSELVTVNTITGAARVISGAGLYGSVSVSPGGDRLLVTRYRRPFSYRVPYAYFSRTIEVLTMEGEKLATVADLPVSDAVPAQGVPTGPRSVLWHQHHPARLLWVEALDGGDPARKAGFRDRIMALDHPYRTPPKEILQLPHRYDDLEFTGRPDMVLLTEYQRERRWVNTYLIDLRSPSLGRMLFSRSVNDAYGDPGSPVSITEPDGRRRMLQEGDWIYMAGEGATPEGDRPFLKRVNLKTKETVTLFRSREKRYEEFGGFLGNRPTVALVTAESPTDVPNLHTLDLTKGGAMRPVTAFTDPHPQITGIRKKLVTYRRADGVPLSGTLYLPKDHVEGSRAPLVIWAYPLEYSDPSTAGQVRGSQHRFTFLRGTSPLFFVLKGYAVLMDATMPVVGDPETVNNTFVEQIVSSADAAIRCMDSMGVADPGRVLVGGHSYGAFMTVNLLAHSRLFAAGIARSGAYNRTLTPFGFQSERRSLWEARDLYLKVSPFMFADSIRQPLLLIHGQEDNNSGTFPIQSERLFEAVRANGGTARLVMLPKESHGYVAQESVLHVVAEMLEWGEKYVKR
jgi:dipeptidyl aminopeptidase/acylaminoacyl peptidase